MINVLQGRKTIPILDVDFDINWASPQANGLVGWWPPIGAAAGTNRIYERIGQNHGTLNGNMAYTTNATFGQVVTSTGASGDYIGVAHRASLEAATFTVGGWINTPSNGNYRNLFNKNLSYIIRGRGIPAIEYVIWTDTGVKAYTYGTSYAGAWHQWYVSWDGTNFRLWVNGVNVASQTPTGTFSPGGLDIGLGGTASEPMPGSVRDLRYYNRALSAIEMEYLYTVGTRFDLYEIRGNRVWVVGAAGGVSLVVADVDQAQSVDAVALTQHHTLVVADASQAQSVDALALTQHNVLAVADSSQVQSAESVALTQHHALAVADSSQAQSVDGVTLTQHNVLAVADSSQAQAADSVTLGVAGQLAVQEASQAQAVDGVALTQHNILDVQDAVQAQTPDNLSLAGTVLLTVQDVSQAQTASAANLVVMLIIALAQQGQSVDGVALTQHHVLAVADSAQAQSADNVPLGVSFYVVTAEVEMAFVVAQPVEMVFSVSANTEL